MSRDTVVFGLLGPTLDSGAGAERWERWRPTVAVCQHEDLLVRRFELLHRPRHRALAERVAADIRSVSPETQVVPREMEIPDPWDFEAVFAALHDFARAYAFDTEREDYLVHITTGTHVAQICLFLLAESHHLPARLLQTAPPHRPRRSDPGRYTLIDLDLSRYDRIASRFERERTEGTSLLKSGIETRNAAFNRMMARIEEVVVRSQAPVLLVGPTGSGKSQLAARIYELRRARRLTAGPFVELNCATLRGDAAMSALFGHVKGAFTGALQDRAGLLRQADKGLLFLDEIGELGLDEQAMLLRALEHKRFLPLGSDREVSSDFQLLAGTHRDLHAWSREGRFREDLLARIDLWTFRLPGLRERPEDIAPNLDYELEQDARRHGRRVTFNREARERFLDFATGPGGIWKRNFRDLSGAVMRLCTLAPGGRVNAEMVAEEIARLRSAWGAAARLPDDESSLAGLLGAEAVQQLDLFERVQLAAVVGVARRCRSLSDAGRQLFAVSRERKRLANDADRLRKYLARYGLTWERVRQAPAGS